MDFARSAHPTSRPARPAVQALAGRRPAWPRAHLGAARAPGPAAGRLPPVFHVAGTNGKGSTVAFLRAALEAAGHKVHAFTSPHLVRFNERIRIAGSLIADEPLAELLTEMLDASGAIEPSFFEVATAVAMLAFARTPADACILEVGLGGRLDATNVIDARSSRGSPISRSITSSFSASACPASRRRKRGSPRRAFRSSRSCIRRRSAGGSERSRTTVGALWLPRGGAWDAIVGQGKLRYRDERGNLDLPLPRLPGRHQAMNAALAVAMLRHQDASRARDGAERGNGLGRLAGPAAAARSRPARRKRAKSGSTAATIPSAARQVAQLGEASIRRRQAAAPHIRQPRHQGPAGNAPAVRRDRRHVSPCRSATTPASRPASSPTLRPSWASPPTRTTASRKRSRAIPQDARVLIFGSLYLAGEVLAANGQVPD